MFPSDRDTQYGPATIEYMLMVTLAGLVAFLVARSEFRRKGLDPDLLLWSLFLAFASGVVGARAAGVIDEQGVGVLFRAPIGSIVRTTGSCYLGGLLLGAMVVMAYLWSARAALLVCLDALAPALILAPGIGRVGCHLAGDGCYGVPTTLPWGMAYPRGVVPTNELVHPTPLYETLLALLFFAMLWKIRTQTRPAGWLFGLYLALAALGRFFVEFLRRNPVHFGLTQAQWLSLGMLVLGLLLMRVRRARRSTEEPSLNLSTPS